MSQDVKETSPEFSVRLVVCDHYLTKPVPGLDVIYSEFRGSDIKQVPVLRVFGSAPDGKKACIHIHGVFPYFYLPCPTPNPEAQLLYQVAGSLDKALNIAMKQATSANQHIYKISLVKGLPFYGYHDKEHLFLKVFLYNPGLIKQAVELCSNGAISGQVLQPHESHLNFTLQFFIDFNLFGMSNIDFQSVIFRNNKNSQKSDEFISPESTSLKSESVCFYEADCIASHIINRQRVGNSDGIENPGLEEVWNQELERRRQLNVSMASKSLSQGRLNKDETDSHYKFENMFNLKLSQLLDKPVETDNIISPNDVVNYPAETQDGSQLLNATDISNHVHEHLLNSTLASTFSKRNNLPNQVDSCEFDNTIVDEDIALNSSLSLQYSQILLDNEDMELVDMLQHLDEKPVEEDSIMGTQGRCDSEEDSEFDDTEYSKIFNDDTILIERGNEDTTEDVTSWNDSFWDGANIPQLDGTCDDDHVKKVRKRKMRPIKVGLSRPKQKKNAPIKPTGNNESSTAHKEEIDEINVSQEIDNVSSCHLRKNNSSKIQSVLNDSNKKDDESIEILVNNLKRRENVERDKKYEEWEPVAGPSRAYDAVLNNSQFNMYQRDSSPDDNGIAHNTVLNNNLFKMSPSDSNKKDDESIEILVKKFEKRDNVERDKKSEEWEPVAGPSRRYDAVLNNSQFNMSQNDSSPDDNEIAHNTVLNNSFLNMSHSESSPDNNEIAHNTVLNNSLFEKSSSDFSPDDKRITHNKVVKNSLFNISLRDSSPKNIEIAHNTISNNTIFGINNSGSSEDDNGTGITSFYDASKLFDSSMEADITEKYVESNDQNNLNNTKSSIIKKEIKIEYNSFSKTSKSKRLPQTELSSVQLCNNIFKVIAPKIRPPNKTDILNSLAKYSIPNTKNPEPYYSNHRDVGDKVELGHVTLKVKSNLSHDQKPYERVLNVTSIEDWRHLLFLQSNDLADENSKTTNLQLLLSSNRHCILTPLRTAITKSDVIKWLEHKAVSNDSEECDSNKKECKIVEEINSSQAIGLNETELNRSRSLEASEKDMNDLEKTMQVTMQPDGSFLCFGNTENKTQNSSCTPAIEVDFLTTMILEVHAEVRGDLHPDPEVDQIRALFVTVFNDCPPEHCLQRNITHVFVVDKKEHFKLFDRCTFDYNVSYFSSENEILEKLIHYVKIHDPDIMCGYEIEMNSWGYVIERSQALGIEMVREISRITEKNRQKRRRNDDNELEGRVIGRITFNVWRLFRYELALSSYSFENCMYEILKERVPTYSHAQLVEWWNHESRMFRWIPFEHYITRLSGTLRMLEKLDIINRTSELARLFGLQWWEVLSRGSQFRVESLMLRAARPLNLIALSPTVKQRAAMRAPESLPLIFEPESRFYSDPVIVLDFQSLYPSMMIAYNYCFSTCVGRVQNINGDAPYEFGAWKLRIPKAKLQALGKDGHIHWSPVGVGFVKPSVRRGVLPALLRRILAARQAVKKGMKLQTDENVKKAMHSRQLGLKLIANVTYGYTAANFSGRQPCVEVGDSVVAKGRETLERAISLVSTGPWNAKVVYGDTDSLFVQVPGGSRAEAFLIGQQIADAVTADNPSPVALKLEKVYQPCILQTKKRYVGYMYESADQQHPVYEAKGIETVRRDGCPAGVKLLQSALCELFSHGDASRVKRLVEGALAGLECTSPLELVFTREYHGAAGYRPGAAAPPNEIAKRTLCRDGRAAPRVGWRVRWVVCAGAPGEALVRLARSPAELLRDRSLRPHTHYYIARALLPPLHRCLSLLGLDVFKWWKELGCNRESQSERTAGGGIARYMHRGRCALCGARGWRAVCDQCGAHTTTTAAAFASRGARARALLHHCYKICESCCGHRQYLQCENTECPVLWRRVSAREKLEELQDIIVNLPSSYNKEYLDF